MHVTSCEARDVDHCVDHQGRRRGRHLDVDHLRRVHLHLVHHLDVDRQNLGARHRDHLDVDHLVRRGDLLDLDGRQDLDEFLGRDGFLVLDERQGLDGSQKDLRGAIREQCADLEGAE